MKLCERYAEFKSVVLAAGWSEDQLRFAVAPPADLNEYAFSMDLDDYEYLADKFIHERKNVGIEVKLAANRWASVANLAEASIRVRRHIEINDLGVSRFHGGSIIHDGTPIARVSYNGRLWAKDGSEIIPEGQRVS